MCSIKSPMRDDGPLKGRPLMLVGRTDPRGEVEYNFVLGAHRAETVGDYLTGLGVSKEKVVATTAASSTPPEPTTPAGARSARRHCTHVRSSEIMANGSALGFLRRARNIEVKLRPSRK